ncbi:MAG: hypothetical protein HQL69_23000 [Magnetococcales bacterium]|nr:hypothetical protein [Magnetococcales bacterium]
MKTDETMLTKAEVKDREGWTEAGIKKFLGKPDKTTTNMYRRSGPKVQLFDIKRIDLIEKTKEFKTWKEASLKRSKTSKKAADNKRQELSDQINSLKIEIPLMQDDVLIERACKSQQAGSLSNFDHVSMSMKDCRDSDDEFLHRIVVNYLRHEYTHYETELEELSGKTGRSEAYILLLKRIFDAISEQYPWLEYECMRQLDKKEDQFLYTE